MQGDHDLRRQVRELKDRQDIYDCLVRYCRGVDRLDRDIYVEVRGIAELSDDPTDKIRGNFFKNDAKREEDNVCI